MGDGKLVYDGNRDGHDGIHLSCSTGQQKWGLEVTKKMKIEGEVLVSTLSHHTLIRQNRSKATPARKVSVADHQQQRGLEIRELG